MPVTEFSVQSKEFVERGGLMQVLPLQYFFVFVCKTFFSCDYFLYLRTVKKQKAMKHGAIKNIVVAGCKKSPVAVFAPVCCTNDIYFM